MKASVNSDACDSRKRRSASVSRSSRSFAHPSATNARACAATAARNSASIQIFSIPFKVPRSRGLSVESREQPSDVSPASAPTTQRHSGSAKTKRCRSRPSRASPARHATSLRQREFRIFHKSFTVNDLIQVCQPRFPRSFPHLSQDSSGPCRPAADDSGTMPDGFQPRLAELEPAPRTPCASCPAASKTGGPSVQDRPTMVQRVSHIAPDGRPRPPTGCKGIFALDLDQPDGTSLSRLRRAGKPALSRSNAWASAVVPDCGRRSLPESRGGGEPAPHPTDPHDGRCPARAKGHGPATTEPLPGK